MKVDARWLDHAMRLHYCKQIQCALKSGYFCGIWNFTQEVASWRYWSLSWYDENKSWDILQNFTAILVILPFAISV